MRHESAAPEQDMLTEMGLLKKAAPFVEVLQGRLPTATELFEITREYGTELATAVLWRAIQATEPHGDFARQVRAFEGKTKLDLLNKESLDLKAVARQFEVTIIASNSFLSGRRWGDHAEPWRLWARELGFKTDIIETSSKLSVSGNARVISEHLRREPRPHRILLSYGQGSSEVRLLFDRRLARDRKTFEGHGSAARELDQVRGWINVCGTFSGSKMNEILRRSWFRRMTTQFAMGLKRRNRLTLAETSTDFPLWRRPIQVPEQALVTSLVGLPYLSQITEGLRASYLELAKLGPNDGVVLALDALASPGLIVPVQGLTHKAEGVILKPILQRLLLMTAVTMSPTVAPSSVPQGGSESLLIHDVGKDQRRHDRGV